MGAQPGADVRAGIGTRLRAAREKKSLTVLQAAEKLHVDPRIIESLESEDFAALGAAVYARGHLRHYAELIGEQAAELQELYSNSTRAAPAQPDLTRISRPPPEPDPGKLAGPAVVVLVVVAAVGTVWWLMSHPTEKPLPALVQSSAPVSSSERAGGPEGSGEESESAPTVDRNTQPTGAQPATAVGSSTGSGKSGANAAMVAGATVQTRSTASTGAVTTAALGAVAPSNRTAAVAPPTTRGGKEGQLTLKFSADSWAEVYDASGQRLFYDVGSASTAHTVKGPAPMRVVLGNAAGVLLEFNGRATPVPTSPSPDGSVRFTINAHGRTVPATNGE
jgi:cytoskeleton protein RodZ